MWGAMIKVGCISADRSMIAADCASYACHTHNQRVKPGSLVVVNGNSLILPGTNFRP